MNDITDDWICFSKLKLLPEHWVARLTPVADRFWFLSIFFDLHAVANDAQSHYNEIQVFKDKAVSQTLCDKLFMCNVSICKLLSDLVFCTCDVLQLDGPKTKKIQIFTGALSAILGTYKLCVKSYPK